jgi:Cu/Ag efflux protein CusF
MTIMRVLAALFMFAITANTARAQNVFMYQVTGVVRAMPGNGRASNELLVKHAPIPQYRDSAGNVVGMKAMTMPFYLADDVNLEGIRVGDSIAMTVKQRLKPDFWERVVEIHKVKE